MTEKELREIFQNANDRMAADFSNGSLKKRLHQSSKMLHGSNDTETLICIVAAEIIHQNQEFMFEVLRRILVKHSATQSASMSE